MQSLSSDIHVCSRILDWLFMAENHPIKTGILYRYSRDGILLFVHVQSGLVEIVIMEDAYKNGKKNN